MRLRELRDYTVVKKQGKLTRFRKLRELTRFTGLSPWLYQQEQLLWKRDSNWENCRKLCRLLQGSSFCELLYLLEWALGEALTLL